MEGAAFLGRVSTAQKYRFYSVRDEFPGFWPVSESGGTVSGELYELPYSQLRERLLPNEPPELELTVIELEDSSGSLSMRMRDDAIGRPEVVDITDYGGWHAYMASK